jgi:hypothetical protein
MKQIPNFFYFKNAGHLKFSMIPVASETDDSSLAYTGTGCGFGRDFTRGVLEGGGGGATRVACPS